MSENDQAHTSTTYHEGDMIHGLSGQISKNLDSGYFAAERLGVDGEFDENNEEDLSSLRVQQKFRLLSAMTRVRKPIQLFGSTEERAKESDDDSHQSNETQPQQAPAMDVDDENPF
ncbi:hypothetical protein B0H14DRAFT_2567416 [Mycena olivaceomarginata]|nr:hypothetical protein B0H14DRAFT_2567416 [Mycena olivaceomarginata]